MDDAAHRLGVDVVAPGQIVDGRAPFAPQLAAAVALLIVQLRGRMILPPANRNLECHQGFHRNAIT